MRRFLRQWNWDVTRTESFHSQGFCRLTPHHQPCFWVVLLFPWNIRFSCRQSGWGAFLSFVPKNLAGWATSALLGLLQNSKIQGGIFVTAGTWGGCVTELSREIHQKSEFGDLKWQMWNAWRDKGPELLSRKPKSNFGSWRVQNASILHQLGNKDTVGCTLSHWCSDSLL